MVKTKFKQTEIGLIPEDWEVKILSKYSELINGRAYSIYEWEKRGIPVIRLQNLTGGDNYYFSTLKLPAKNYCESGDLLYMWSATFGPFIWKSVKAIFHYHIWKIETNREFLNKTYLYYKLEEITESLKRTASNGGTMLHITKSFMDSLTIPLPPLPEQQAIAKALSDTDAWIESLEKLIDKKRLIKQGAMQELLTPKEDWEDVMLGDYVTITSGESPSKFNFGHTGIPYFKVEQLNDRNKEIFKTPFYILSNNKVVSANSIIFPKRGASILLNKIRILRDNSFMDTNLMALTTSNELYYEYLFYILTYTNLSKVADTTSIPQINNKHITPYQIPLPSVSEQIRIATILSDMDAEIEALENKLDKAKQLKQGMMQELLTGRIRLVKSVETIKNESKPAKGHNDQFNDAVLIATMASVFSSDKFPLTRFKYTKVSYLLKRYKEEQDAGYLKHAAGPYKPKTRYGGAEKIAINKKYIDVVATNYKGKEYEGFVASENVDEAIKYFEDWYGADALKWIEQFKFEKNDNLELWATIDMAIEDLKKKDEMITVGTIKQVLKENKEWKDKLKRSIFSDFNIKTAITKLETLFT
mgnify:CR=1 FL=1